MSHFRRQVTRVDAVAKSIIEALEGAGYTVVVIGYPVDLLVRHKSFPPRMWMLMEAKTALSKTGRTYTMSPAKAKKMQKQLDFISAHDVPVVTSSEQALSVGQREIYRGFGETR